MQHCCDIVSNGYNIVPALQCCVVLKSLLQIVSWNITLIHKLMSHGTIHMQQRLLAQHSITTLLRYCFELFSFFNIATLCCAQNRRCSLSPRVFPSHGPILSCAHYFQAPATRAKGLVGSQPRSRVLSYTRGEQERTLGTRLSGEHRTSEKCAKGVMGTSAERERGVVTGR